MLIKIKTKILTMTAEITLLIIAKLIIITHNKALECIELETNRI